MALKPADLDDALLSMHAYNRGVGASLPVADAPYDVILSSASAGLSGFDFPATAYKLGGTAVIAFRGTDALISAPLGAGLLSASPR